MLRKRLIPCLLGAFATLTTAQTGGGSQYPSTGLPTCAQLCFESSIQQGCGSINGAVNCICTTPAPVQNMQFCLKSSQCSPSDANKVLQFVLEFCPGATRGLPPGFSLPTDGATSSGASVTSSSSGAPTNSTTRAPSTSTVVVTTSSSPPPPIIVSQTVTSQASAPPDVTVTAVRTASFSTTPVSSSASSSPTLQQNSFGIRPVGTSVGALCLGILGAVLGFH